MKSKKRRVSNETSATQKCLRLMSVTTFLVLFVSYCNAQSYVSNFNPDSSKTITIAAFDSLVSRSTVLLRTKKLSDIADADHVTIMMCLNTILSAPVKPGCEIRFAYDNYRQLFRLSEESDYASNMEKLNPEWTYTKGATIYFPRLHMELYGWARPYAKFKVTYVDRHTTTLVDSTTGSYFVLDPPHVLVTAFDVNGKILWKTDPWKDNNLKKYQMIFDSTYRALITYFVLGPKNEKSWCKVPSDTRALWIGLDSRQFGYLDIRNGKFEFCGQD